MERTIHRQRKRRGAAAGLALLCLAPLAAGAETPRLEVAGLEIGAVDLGRSAELYRDVLGFSPAGNPGDEVRLVNGGVEIVLRRSAGPATFDPTRQAHFYLNLEVSDLEATVRELEKRGLALLGPPRETAIGLFAALRDPSGNVHQVVESRPRSPRPFPPRVFNIGIRIESMDAAKRFYCGALGFEVLSENHPPPIIPLKPRGSAPLILFEGIPARAADGAEVARSVLVLETSDLAAVLAGLRQRGLEVPGDGAKEVLLEDPSGNRIKLRQAGG